MNSAERYLLKHGMSHYKNVVKGSGKDPRDRLLEIAKNFSWLIAKAELHQENPRELELEMKSVKETWEKMKPKTGNVKAKGAE